MVLENLDLWSAKNVEGRFVLSFETRMHHRAQMN